MNWIYLSDFADYGLYALLAVVFGVVLVHVLRGTKGKWLTSVTILMLVSSTLFAVSGTYFFFPSLAPIEDLLDVYFICFYVFWSLSGLAHAMLAFKYKRIALKMPEHLDNRPPSVETLCSRVTEWALLIANAVLPFLVLLFLGDLITMGLYGQEPSTFAAVSLAVLWTTIGVIHVISGVISVRSVVQIRQFFKDRKALDYIDTKMLLKHALAFAIYLLEAIINIFLNVADLLGQSQVRPYLISISAVSVAICSFISGVFLANIFWHLGTRVRPSEEAVPIQPVQTASQSIPTVADWDEDAQLQATIWNIFVRNRADSERFKVRPTSSSLPVGSLNDDNETALTD